MGSNRIRIYISGEDRILRESLAAHLSKEANLEVVGTSAPGETLNVLGGPEKIDIVLLDADAIGEVAQTLIESALHRGLTVKFLVLTAGMPQMDAVWFLRHGVAGLFLKRNSTEVLLEAIQMIAGEGKWLDQPFLRLVLSNLGGVRGSSVPVLTQREHATLRWLVEGCTNKQIGEHLGISEAAVKATLQRLFEKMGVRTRGHLIRLAVEQQKTIS